MALDKQDSKAANLADYDRMLIELCTNEDSKMGEPTVASQGCFVVRVTIQHDLTTLQGLQFALDAVLAWCRHRRKLKLGIDIMLWISIPCTDGSEVRKPAKGLRLKLFCLQIYVKLPRL